jgi:mycofactocin biosynthesis protein MftB
MPRRSLPQSRPRASQSSCWWSTNCSSRMYRLTACAASTSDPTTVASELDRAWCLAPETALRSERFGGLAYSFTTRRLSFLKSRRLFDVVSMLDEHSSSRAACLAAGVTDQELPQILAALQTLAATGMLEQRVER